MPGPRGDGLTLKVRALQGPPSLEVGPEAQPCRFLQRPPVALIMTVIPFCYTTRPIDSILPRRSSRAEFYVYNSLNKRA